MIQVLSARTHTQSDLALSNIDADHACVCDNLSLNQNVVYVIDAVVGDLGDVQQGRPGSIATRGVLGGDERSEVAHIYDFSGDSGPQFQLLKSFELPSSASARFRGFLSIIYRGPTLSFSDRIIPGLSFLCRRLLVLSFRTILLLLLLLLLNGSDGQLQTNAAAKRKRSYSRS